MATNTICSVFFQPLKAWRAYAETENSGFAATFKIPEVQDRDSFELLIVGTTYENQQNGSQQSFRTPIYPEHLADDLVNEWRDQRRFVEVGRPGIMVIAGEKPTSEELAQMHTWQDQWCEAHYSEAEDMFANGARAGITKLHRDCAKHLGRESAEWVYNQAPTSLISCPLCTAKIDSASIVCRECKNVVDFEKFVQHQAKQTEYEAKVAEMRNKTELAAATAPQGKLVVPPLPQIPKLAGK